MDITGVKGRVGGGTWHERMLTSVAYPCTISFPENEASFTVIPKKAASYQDFETRGHTMMSFSYSVVKQVTARKQNGICILLSDDRVLYIVSMDTDSGEALMELYLKCTSTRVLTADLFA